jgi:hypothetical protein
MYIHTNTYIHTYGLCLSLSLWCIHTSPEGYAAGHWRSSEPAKDPALTIQVRKDMKKPSSFEDGAFWVTKVFQKGFMIYGLGFRL